MRNKLSLLLLIVLLLASCCKLSRRSTSASPFMPVISQERMAFFKEGLPIYFASGSSAITDEAKERMESLIAVLRGVRRVTLVLRGYADRSERQAYKLARQRVAVVKDILDNSGVIDSSVTIQQEAFGDNDPLISYNTVNNNPRSRRVDVFIFGR